MIPVGRTRVKLAYVTASELYARNAHALQISAMTRAFRQALREEFAFIRPVIGETSDDTVEAQLLSVPSRPRIARQAAIAAKAAHMLRGGGACPLVFVRELPLAAVLRTAGLPVVLELHSMPQPAALPLLRWLGRQSRFGLLAISGALEDHLRLAAAPRDLTSRHDGVFQDDYPPLSAAARALARASMGVQEGRVLALYTGSLYKGRDARTFKEIGAAFPQADIVVCGGEGALLNELRAYYADLPNVRCLGHRPPEEARRLQQAADVLLYPLTRSNPLWRHTSPLKVFEYMAAGGLIVGSNIGSVGEVLTPDNAFVFDGDESGAMSRAFGAALAAGEEEKTAKHRRCRELVTERYDWKRRVEFILDRWCGMTEGHDAISVEARAR